MQEISNKNIGIYRMDVVAIRLLLIFMLIFYHALCPYTGSWEIPFDSFKSVELYNWIGTLSHQGQLQGMTFLSGLLLAHGMIKKNRSVSLRSQITSKAKRILLPCLFFGVLYYVIFYDLTASCTTILLRILNGCGHLWYLPMIFWCFVITYIVTYFIPIKVLDGKIYSLSGGGYKLILLLSIVLAVINPLMFLPFGLGTVFNYYIYFYIGFCLRCGLLKFPDYNCKNLMISISVFIVAFVLYMFVREHWILEKDFVIRLLRYFVTNFFVLIMSLNCLYILYSIANRPTVLQWINGKTFLITLSGYCYGVYIYQQFILKILYYKTLLPLRFDEIALPWICFVITLILSLLLCWLTLKTRFGRFLIG